MKEKVMLTLGYDIGSSSIKAALYNVNTGKELAHSTFPKNEMKISSPKPGLAEQNPETWWNAVKSATQELFQISTIKPNHVKAIGISYQMHGLVLVDKNSNNLRPSIIWCDSRAVEIGDKAFNEIGKEKCLKTVLNSPGNFTASKLKWVKDNEPEISDKINKMMLPGDYIAMKLTGEINTTKEGLSEAILWNFVNEQPAEVLMQYYKIDNSLLPQIVPTFGNQGIVNSKASLETGLPEGIPVTYRAGDQPNNAFSLNVLKPGEIAATAGTSGVIYGITDEIKYDAEGRINTFLHVNQTEKLRRLGILLCINGAGISNSWIRKTLFNSNISYEDMNTLTGQIDIGANGVSFLPFGNGAERMLKNIEPGAVFSGLNFNHHNQKHLLRAVLEGVAFSFIYGINILDELAVQPKVIRAGMANMFLSGIFREAISTLSGAAIQLYNTDGALGAARAAAYGAGFYSSFDEAFDSLECLMTVEPDTNNADKYGSAYKKWLKELKIHL